MNFKRQTKTYRRTGFTLIELLTVIAIIGVLAGILIPVIGSAKKTALKAKTKARYNNYATAAVQYKAEYGYYPTLNVGGGVPNDGVNLKSRNDEFFKSLGAVEYTTGSGFSRWQGSGNDRRELNPKLISFYSFGEADIASQAISVGGENVTRGDLVDDFFNPNIRMAIENQNGVVEVPTRSGDDEEISTEVAFWTDDEDGAGFEDVFSWN